MGCRDFKKESPFSPHGIKPVWGVWGEGEGVPVSSHQQGFILLVVNIIFDMDDAVESDECLSFNGMVMKRTLESRGDPQKFCTVLVIVYQPLFQTPQLRDVGPILRTFL